MDLNTIQEQLKVWQRHNFEGRPNWQPVMGVAEEAGELSHAFLKMSQSIRGSEEKHIADFRDAVGDICIFLMDACNGMAEMTGDYSGNWQLPTIIEDTWYEVRDRNWRPEKGELPNWELVP